MGYSRVLEKVQMGSPPTIYRFLYSGIIELASLEQKYVTQLPTHLGPRTTWEFCCLVIQCFLSRKWETPRNMSHGFLEHQCSGSHGIGRGAQVRPVGQRRSSNTKETLKPGHLGTHRAFDLFNSHVQICCEDIPGLTLQPTV